MTLVCICTVVLGIVTVQKMTDSERKRIKLPKCDSDVSDMPALALSMARSKSIGKDITLFCCDGKKANLSEEFSKRKNDLKVGGNGVFTTAMSISGMHR